VDHNNNVYVDNIYETINNVDELETNESSELRDTSPITINSLDPDNVTHIESESNGNMIQEFTEKLQDIVQYNNMNNRIYHIDEINN
jgi:hypothetical protein